MTPLAKEIFRDYLQPGQSRRFDFDNPDIMEMADARFFDLSDILKGISSENVSEKDAARKRLEVLNQAAIDHEGKTTFLPAPKVWLEWLSPDSDRDFRPRGLLVTEMDTCPSCGAAAGSRQCDACDEYLKVIWYDLPGNNHLVGALIARHPPYRIFPIADANAEFETKSIVTAQLVRCCLHCINHRPAATVEHNAVHRGLRRDLKRRGIEIIEDTTSKIVLRTLPEASEGRRSGPQAPKRRHGVRSHLRRLRSGKVVKVKAHWRGDEGLGIVESDYEVHSPAAEV